MAHSSTICITGISGSFPKSNNVSEFYQNCLIEKDIRDEIPHHWKVMLPHMFTKVGKLNNLNKFDAGFFGIHYQQAESMDPGCKKLLENAIFAIMDAGVSPKSLKGSKTGVFVATNAFQESEKSTLYDNLSRPHFGFTGCTRSMTAHWLSYVLGLEGPSVAIDAACSSSLYALEHGFQAIRSGKCDNAIIGGVNLLLNYNTAKGYYLLGIINPSSKVRAFDESGKGTMRTEGVATIFLQKSENAKRIYANVVNAKVNHDGFKKHGITLPSQDMLEQLTWELCEEAQIKPELVNFVEAHATGTRLGDPIEVAAIENAYCANRKTPLYIGSVKSNIGHTETASGLVSVIKIILQIENNCLIPNINFENPRKDIKAFHNGKIRVVTQFMEDYSKYYGVQNSGIGGANAQILLERHQYLPEPQLTARCRLLCISGRNKDSCQNIFKSVQLHSKQEGYLSLLQGIYEKNIEEFMVRGYIFLENGKIVQKLISDVSRQKYQLCVVLAEPNYDWIRLLQDLYTVMPFKLVLQSLFNTIPSVTALLLEKIVASRHLESNEILLGSVISQIATIEILKFMDIEIHYIIGFSSGVISCAYANNVITLSDAAALCDQLILENIINGDESCLKQIAQAVDNNMIVSLRFPNNKSEKREILNFEINTSIADILKNFPQQLAVLSIQFLQLPGLEQYLIRSEKFLNSIGQLYVLGFNPTLEKLHPEVSHSVKAPFISSLLQWKQDEEWRSFEFHPKLQYWGKTFKISLNNDSDNWNFLKGHNINGTILFPATGYLYIVWNTYLEHSGLILEETKVVFENVRFLNRKILSLEKIELIIVQIHKITKKFEVRDLRNVLATGRIFTPSKSETLSDISSGHKSTRTIHLKDIYRYFTINRYCHQDDFRGLEETSLDRLHSSVRWKGNWITFLDAFLQTMIIKEKIKELLVPTGIDYFMIDPRLHFDCSSIDHKFITSTYTPSNCNVVRSRGIELRGLKTVPMLVKAEQSEPILENYSFISLNSTIQLELAIQVILQLVLENLYGNKLHITEIEESTWSPLSPVISKIFQKEPSAHIEIKVFSKTPDLYSHTITESKTFEDLDSGNNLVIVSHVLDKPNIIAKIFKNIQEEGFVLTREHKKTFDCCFKTFKGIEVLSVYKTEEDVLILLRKMSNSAQPKVIYLESLTTSMPWIKTLQHYILKNERVLLVSENGPESGILGLVKCLKCEIGPKLLSCICIQDQIHKFDINNDFFVNQICKGLLINVLRYGEWGTYRHLPLVTNPLLDCYHFMGTFAGGNIKEVQWIEGPISKNTDLPSTQILIQNFYIGLNFKDIVSATGMVPIKQNINSFTDNYCLGLEFAGIDPSGRRVMGIAENGTLSNLSVADPYLTWEIPKEWSMEDAATVPITYSTILPILIEISQLKKGQSILIHAAAGGIGLSAINVALHYNCNIFATVGSLEKREFLKKLYPLLPDKNIGNSRDCSFYEMIMKETKGRGVDLIINSLAKEKLRVGLRCLAKKGKFFEIGKWEEYKNRPLQFDLLDNHTLCAVQLDRLLVSERKKILWPLISRGIREGYIKPLPRTVYDYHKITDAVSIMSQGKNIAKIVLKVTQNLNKVPFRPSVVPMFHCLSQCVYIVVGGMGGFGMELIDWLIRRGGKKMVIVTRKSILRPYQSFKLREWQEGGITVNVVAKDLSLKENCTDVLRNASKLGSVDGIFILSVVLKDALFENQTQETFVPVFVPKVTIAANLDLISRKLCPNLRKFVTFSSISSGRGNVGQTNYGMANAMMEHICENRKRDGFPGLAIQWGPIKDVGLFADMEQNVSISSRSSPQELPSCFKALNVFLSQSEPIVSSTVVLQETHKQSTSSDIISSVTKVLGINKSYVSLHSSLAEIGLNSMANVEILQLLERDFGISLSLNELRKITFNELKSMTADNK